MEFVSAVLANENQTIDLDYLSYNPYSIQTEIVDCKKGYFVHISSVEDNRYVADGIVSDVQPDKFTQKISIRPLQALFDADIFSTRITDCVTWIKDAITSIFISNSDTLQNRPIKLTYTKPSKDLPLTESFDETSNDTFNILSVISSALKHYNVVTACYLDMKNMQIRVRIYQNKATKTIEGDLENVIKSDATLGDSYGSINKVVVRRFINLASGYLSCDTEAAQQNKIVSVSNDFTVEEGGFYAVRFSEDVPAGSSLIFTTRVENSNDPVVIANLPMYYAGASIPGGTILGGLTALFVDLDGKANLIELVNDKTAYCYIIGYTSFFRDVNGKISDSVKKKKRIVPVFVRHISIEQPSDMSYADWYIEALTQSVEILTPEQYDQEIQLTYHINDKIVEPLDMSIGTVTTIHYKGETYTSIYAEKKLKGNLITLVFGAVRTDLTKKLSNKTGGGTTSSGGYTGSSGGGGGGETGTTNYNKLSNKPAINGVTLTGDKSLSDLGIPTSYSDLSSKPSINNVTLSGNKSLSDLGIPTTYAELSDKPSINGTTLSGNKTAAELGLQNELIAGNGISISNQEISIADLIIDCGSSTVNVGV